MTQASLLRSVEKALEGYFEDFLTDLFIKFNLMNFLSHTLDGCVNKEGGSQSRHEDRFFFAKSIVEALKRHAADQPLKVFFNVVTRMGTWKRMNHIIE